MLKGKGLKSNKGMSCRGARNMWETASAFILSQASFLC